MRHFELSHESFLLGTENVSTNTVHATTNEYHIWVEDGFLEAAPIKHAHGSLVLGALESFSFEGDGAILGPCAFTECKGGDTFGVFEVASYLSSIA